MQITKPKAIMPKFLPLFLSLAISAGLLPVSPLGTVLIKDAEARAAVSGPRGGAAVAGPRGAAAVGPRGNAVVATPRNYVHTGSASVTAGPRRAYAEGPRGGEAYVGPRGAAVQGPRGGTAVVRTMPVGARALAIAGVTYYVASGVYYRPVYQGSEVVYQQVPNPETQ
ncbi:MAG: hypothetical protein M1438_20275 [Deltaproteobacteria bacterium]|nr:hypothetical protein [Deltaproteobacteria bacterium]